MDECIAISEIFGPTIQGEGALLGRPTVFVRTGGCDFRCVWCDSLHAVLPQFRETWQKMTANQIFSEIEKLSHHTPLLVTLSGGNPALAPLGPLIELGRARGYEYALETQGTVARPWFSRLRHLVLSPKPPSSQMVCDSAALHACLQAADDEADISFKVVAFDEADYHWAHALYQQFPQYRWFLQPGNSTVQNLQPTDVAAAVDVAAITARTEALLRLALADGWTAVTIAPQLHTLLWGNLRGV